MNGPHLSAILTFAVAIAHAPATIADKVTQDRTEGADVVLVEPEHFTDLKPSYLAEQFRDYVQRRAAQYLADGRTVTVTINDIDMAGGFEPWRGPQFFDVRILRDVYPPRIDLSFELTDADGAVLASGERKLKDLTYLMRVRPKSDPDQLAYEKQILDEWMRKEFR